MKGIAYEQYSRLSVRYDRLLGKGSEDTSRPVTTISAVMQFRSIIVRQGAADRGLIGR